VTAPEVRSAGALRHVPNVISALRLAAVPVLGLLAWRGEGELFTWLLVVAMLSDIADGLIARMFRLTSKLGALLDSIADTLLLFAAGYGSWVFHPDVVREHWPAGAVLLGFWVLENIAALARYRRLSSFHTYLSKAAGYALGIFVGVLFVFGFQAWLLYLAVGLSVAGNIEELWLLRLLPEWEADVKGAWWVHRRRSRAP
jgi:CDP-diacylglycerol--glycerol-3-phosphate 3-phosphatidyltransferase